MRLFATLCLLFVAVAATAAEPLVVYSGRKEALVGPLFAQFEQTTGIKLQVHYNKTPALATQLAAEQGETPCDVFYAQDSGYLGALANAGLVIDLPQALTSQVDSRFSNGKWVGISGRLRVLVYNSKNLSPESLPQSLEELADERWRGKIGWAPGNASFQAHVSALRHHWGDDKTRAWLTAVKANGAKNYPKNSPQVLAASNGEISIGWVNHYYLHKLAAQAPHSANFSFPEAGKLGNVLMVSGASITKASKRQADAEKLLNFLVSEAAQNMLTQDGFEYPVRPGVTINQDLPDLSAIPLAMVNQEHLTDVGPTLEMLRAVGLQ